MAIGGDSDKSPISKYTLAKYFGIGTLASFMGLFIGKLAILPWEVHIRGDISIETIGVVAMGIITAVVAYFGFSREVVSGG